MGQQEYLSIKSSTNRFTHYWDPSRFKKRKAFEPEKKTEINVYSRWLLHLPKRTTSAFTTAIKAASAKSFSNIFATCSLSNCWTKPVRSPVEQVESKRVEEQVDNSYFLGCHCSFISSCFGFNSRDCQKVMPAPILERISELRIRHLGHHPARTGNVWLFLSLGNPLGNCYLFAPRNGLTFTRRGIPRFSGKIWRPLANK